MLTKLFWVPLTSIVWTKKIYIFPNFLFCISQKKESHQIWNDMRGSKWWPNVHFWVNYPINFISSLLSLLLLCCHCRFFVVSLCVLVVGVWSVLMSMSRDSMWISVPVETSGLQTHTNVIVPAWRWEYTIIDQYFPYGTYCRLVLMVLTPFGYLKWL